MFECFFREDILYKKIADSITKQIVKNKDVDKNNFEIYSYGFELLISYLSYLLILVIIAIVTKTVLETLMFSIGFIILRKFAGGYHASTYIYCHILFALNQILFISFIKLIPISMYEIFIYLFIGISVLLVFLLAPVDHPNRRFNENEYKYFKKYSRLYICIILLASLVIIQFPIIHKFLLSYLFGIFSASCSVAVGAVQAKKLLN